MVTDLIAALVVLVSIPCLAMAEVDLAQPLPVDEDTISLFHLDDVATGEVQDAAGGRLGSAADAVPTIGRFGGALSCTGTGRWVDVTDLPDTAPRDGITVECWVKFPNRAGGDIICRNQSYMIRIGSTVEAYFSIDGRWRPVSGTSSVPVGRWTHLAITYSRVSKEVRIYIDGALDVAREPNGITEGILDAGSSVLRLGANTWNPSAMNGKLDEVRVSSVARTYRPLRPAAPAPISRDTNLVANPSYESGMYGWRITSEGNGLRLWHIEHGDAAQGRAFLRASNPEARTVISYPFNVARGKTCTVSAAMRADRPCRGLLRLRHTGSGGGRESARTEWFDVSENWQRFSTSFSIPADWPTDSAYLELGASDEALVDVDAVSVVAGEQSEYTQTEAQSIGLDAKLPPQSTYMLSRGARLPIDVTNTGEESRDLTLECAVTDRLGREVHRQQLHVGTVAPGQARRATVDLPDAQVGWFVAHLTVRHDGEALKETERIFNVIEPMKGVGGIEDSHLGMNTHMEREPTEHLNDNLNMLSLCGVKWIRGWWGWGMAEKEPGRFDWTEYDRQLEAVHGAGMEIMPILLRYYPAYEHEWSGETDKIQRPPYDMDQWAGFVRTTAARYRGRVKAWEVWNEPWYTFGADYYAKLLEATYDSIRDVDPDVTVVGFGGSGPDYIRKGFEAGSVKCMDVISVHSYAELTRPFERMEELAEAVGDLAAQFGSTERIWHTEQGSGADGASYRASEQTEDECAVNLVQAYLSALSLGAEKFFWFSAQTTPTYGSGVFYENYVPRPRLVALNGLARVLKGRRLTGRTTLGDGKVACALMDGEAGAAAALWNLDDAMTVSLPAGTQVTQADMLCNPMGTAGPQSPIDLQQGRPVYVLTSTPGVEQLEMALRNAKVSLRGPVGVVLTTTADGKLELALSSDSARNLDLLVTVRAPELFTAAPPSVGMADLAPQETRTVVLAPDSRPAA
ncbi:MAG: hypothetical protein AMK73_01515, partial [Planctomycetes bacterium SM23_32]